MTKVNECTHSRLVAKVQVFNEQTGLYLDVTNGDAEWWGIPVSLTTTTEIENFIRTEILDSEEDCIYTIACKKCGTIIDRGELSI